MRHCFDHPYKLANYMTNFYSSGMAKDQIFTAAFALPLSEKQMLLEVLSQSLQNYPELDEAVLHEAIRRN